MNTHTPGPPNISYAAAKAVAEVLRAACAAAKEGTA
jgi:hypothetical protein